MTKKHFNASHQRSWIWGRHAVTETLAAGRWPVLELYVDESFSASETSQIVALAGRHSVAVRGASASRLEQLCRNSDHQGYVARMGEFPCRTLSDLQKALKEPLQRRQVPLYLVCDRVQDAHNFGAILRNCDAMSVDGIIIGERSQAQVTPHVARSSAGAVNWQELYRVSELTAAVRVLRSSGVQVIAATEKSEGSLWDADLRNAAAILIGNEGSGIAPELLRECDALVSIPMLGRVNSLNAAVATGILLYECRRQQRAGTV
jgi:23S rRNA (guanosine2251-2'-O)-methyltransferase